MHNELPFPRPRAIQHFSTDMGSVFSSSRPVVINPMAQQFVKDNIAKQRVVIFSKSYCPYCTMAKEEFKKIKASFLSIELEDRPDCEDIQDVLGDMTGARSVPRVFIDGKFIGGGTDVKKLGESGQLAKMLA